MGGIGGYLRERGVPFQEHAPLAPRTTFRTGGPADLLAFPGTPEEVADLLRAAGGEAAILGSGANLLVRDGGIRGLVISLERMRGLECRGNRIDVEAGCSFPRLVARTVRAGLRGLEGLAGIPATVGGAIFMNAGGRFGTVSDVVESVDVLDGRGIRRLPRAEIPFGYRTSGLDGFVVLGARLRLEPDDPAAVRRRFEEVARWKRAKQPLRSASAGCVFRNPPGDSAGRLIDAAGLKGLRCGAAVVSHRHANFIVNEGGARAWQILSLAERVRDEVRRRMAVELEFEIRIWGEP